MKKFLLAVMLGVFATSAIPLQLQAEWVEERTDLAIECLAKNIYFESRGSNLADMAAVANVVMNRTKDRRYPNTICGVVHQGKKDASGNMIKNLCQFSWYCDGKPDTPTNEDAWNKAQLLAYQMVEQGKYRGLTEGATHYHATYVKPIWAKDFTLIGRIGEHIFYRWE
tara:strand:- start:1095 stop:1598 length:504 start_codon:yes stop_codon:yes gene_type:complete